MSRQPRPQPLIRFIYVIGPWQGLQKVGLTTDPQSRLATLQTASPFDILMHASVAVPFREAHAFERRAHQILARTRVRNEWFETTPADAVAAVHSAAAPFKRRTTAAPNPAVIWPPTPTWGISRAPAAPSPADRSPLMAFAAARDVQRDAAPIFEFNASNQRSPPRRRSRYWLERVSTSNAAPVSRTSHWSCWRHRSLKAVGHRSPRRSGCSGVSGTVGRLGKRSLLSRLHALEWRGGSNWAVLMPLAEAFAAICAALEQAEVVATSRA